MEGWASGCRWGSQPGPGHQAGSAPYSTPFANKWRPFLLRSFLTLYNVAVGSSGLLKNDLGAEFEDGILCLLQLHTWGDWAHTSCIPLLLTGDTHVQWLSDHRYGRRKPCWGMVLLSDGAAAVLSCLGARPPWGHLPTGQAGPGTAQLGWCPRMETSGARMPWGTVAVGDALGSRTGGKAASGKEQQNIITDGSAWPCETARCTHNREAMGADVATTRVKRSQASIWAEYLCSQSYFKSKYFFPQRVKVRRKK